MRCRQHRHRNRSQSPKIKTGTSIPIADLYPESGWIDALGADDITYFAIGDRTDGGGYLTYRGDRAPDADFHTMTVDKLDDWEFVAGEPGTEDTIGFNIIQADGTYSERIPDSLAATVTATASDLIVEDVEVRGDHYDWGERVDHVFAPGDRLTVEFDVANIGDADAGSTEAGLYFHDGDNWSIPAVDTEGVRSIDVGRSDSGEELSFRFAEDLEDGIYTLVIFADHDQREVEWVELGEGFQDQNIFAFTVPVAKPPPEPPEPEFANLDVGSLTPSTTNWTEGNTVLVQWRVENEGDATASSSQSGVFLSTNDRITTSDLRIGSLQATGALSPNESVNQSTSISVDLDALGVSAGQYYIGAIADTQNQIVESSKSDNDSPAVSINLVDLNAPPNIAVQHDGSFPEDAEGVVATVAASDPDGDIVKLALSGPDAALFDIVSNEVFFLDPPDFEVPRDTDQDNTYAFDVTGSDGFGGEDTISVAVSVTARDTNGPPSGTVTLSGTATAGSTLTAGASGLSDTDGLGAFSYAWLLDGTPISGATGQTYALTQDDVGAQISVEVSYTDGEGTSESVRSAATTVDMATEYMIGGTVNGPGGVPLADTAVRFLIDGEEIWDGQTGSEGSFALAAPPETAGQLAFDRAVTAEDSAQIGVSDALDALRLAVGLDPSWGPADAADFVAADFNADGSVGVSDTLDILRIAVGLDTEESQPRWVFGDTGFADAGADNVPDLDTNIDISALTADTEMNVQGILVGNMENYV